MSEISNKWNQRYQTAANKAQNPALVLRENFHLLPAQGEALDLACGLGANALFLARAGLSVHAWDCSEVAIEKLHKQALSENLNIKTDVRDILLKPPEPDCYDVIVVSYFLDRSLAKILSTALKTKGLLFYQTFTHNKVSETGPTNPNFLLSENELLELFAELRLLVYREENNVGNTTKGLRNEALLVAQKINTEKM